MVPSGSIVIKSDMTLKDLMVALEKVRANQTTNEPPVAHATPRLDAVERDIGVLKEATSRILKLLEPAPKK